MSSPRSGNGGHVGLRHVDRPEARHLEQATFEPAALSASIPRSSLARKRRSNSADAKATVASSIRRCRTRPTHRARRVRRRASSRAPPRTTLRTQPAALVERVADPGAFGDQRAASRTRRTRSIEPSVIANVPSMPDGRFTHQRMRLAVTDDEQPCGGATASCRRRRRRRLPDGRSTGRRHRRRVELRHRARHRSRSSDSAHRQADGHGADDAHRGEARTARCSREITPLRAAGPAPRRRATRTDAPANGPSTNRCVASADRCR